MPKSFVLKLNHNDNNTVTDNEQKEKIFHFDLLAVISIIQSFWNTIFGV